VTTGGPSYAMPIGDRGGVAYVRPTTSGGFRTSVYYGTNAELATVGQSVCAINEAGPKTILGWVVNAAPQEQIAVLFGRSVGFTVGTDPTRSYQLLNALDGPRDLLAVSRVLNPTTNMRDVSKLIVRRNLNPANGSTLLDMDFTGPEAVAPASANLTIGGLGAGEAAYVQTGVYTSRGFIGTIPIDLNAFSTATTQRYYGLMPAQMQAGDLHEINVFTQDGGRTVKGYFTNVVDRPLNLGPALSATTLTTLTAPFVRPRVQLASQGEYANFLTFTLGQGGATPRAVELTATAGYFGGTPATWDVTFPDFAGAAYDADWALRVGAATGGSVDATGVPAGPVTIKGTPVAAGTVLRSGSRTVTFTP
jgi:hypothetical protein